MRLRYCIALLVVPGITAHAQQPVPAPVRDTLAREFPWSTPLVLPGSPGDDARRLQQLLRGDGTQQTLIRSTGTLSERPAMPADAVLRGLHAGVLGPVLAITHNSTLPFSLNDGSMWAGRGLSYRITGGTSLAFRGLSVVIAPEMTYSQNRPVAVIPSGSDSRSMFASPWFSGTYSADLPLRFGNEDLRMVTLGQSRIEYEHDLVAVGASAEDQWWGPGVHNALVLSNNAAGIPHVFLRTAHPVRTRIGDIEARWIIGGLTESIYFDQDSSNDVRALSAAAVTLRLAAEPGLTLGAARAVYSPVEGAGGVPARLFDVFERWGQTSDSDEAREGDPSEQLLSFFGRWVFPTSGLELYGEWTRQELPESLRELLIAPQQSQAFTVGMQAARPAFGGALRGQVEATVLEQTPDNFDGTVQSFYISRLTPQGYTQRGQSIGAGIGPGSSSQWLAVDYLRPAWSFGGEVARIRWNEDVYAQQVTGVQRFAHDVSLLASLRGGVALRGVRFHAAVTREHRLNYLFQNFFAGTYPDARYDEHNMTFRMTAEVAP